MAAKGKGRLLLYDIFDRNPALLEAYDLVLLMDVIEHLDDDLGFLSAALEQSLSALFPVNRQSTPVSGNQMRSPEKF